MTMKRNLLKNIILVVSLMLGVASAFAQEYVEKKTAFNSEKVMITGGFILNENSPLLFSAQILPRLIC